MTFLIQQTMIYAVPLMIVALAGVFAERSGIINLALEGIMILGAFIGVLFVNIMQTNHVYDAAKAAGDWVALQGFELLAMLVAAIFGAIFSLLLSFASVNLRADQTIGGTALNLMAPALVLFLIRIIANQNTLQMATGDAASWFMIKKTTLGYAKTDDLGFLGNTFLHKVYLATYVCIIIFVVLLLAAYVLVKIVFTEAGRVPVDDPRTHLELTMIHEVMCLDYCGVDLAYIKMAGWLKTAALSVLAADAVAATCCPRWWAAAPLAVLVTGLSVGIVESTQARNKLARNTTFILTVAALAVLVFFTGYLLQLNSGLQ